MVDFYIYFYYRTYQLYGGAQRSDGPVGFLAGINIAFCISVFLHCLDYFHALPRSFQPVIQNQIWMDPLIVFLSWCVISALIYFKRMAIGKKFEQFKKESIAERKKMTVKVLLYILLSIALLVLTFL